MNKEQQQLFKLLDEVSHWQVSDTIAVKERAKEAFTGCVIGSATFACFRQVKNEGF
ncbi:MAG: hypothetical protein ACRCU3_06885 [Eubacteriaceae bacterium]